MDEVYLTSGMLHMGYWDLATKVMDYEQKAPIGFLWMVRLFLDMGGNSEVVLRTVPFLSGLASLLLFARMTGYFLKPYGQLLAVAIFALAPAVIYHTVEIKQYATECLATVIALYLFARYKDCKDWQSRLLWAAYGALLIWFSNAVIFVLAGIAISMTVQDILQKDGKTVLRNAVPFTVWLISFCGNYYLFTHEQAASGWLVKWFAVYGYFLPFPPHNVQELLWLPKSLILMMDYPLGLVWNYRPVAAHSVWKIILLPVIPLLTLCCGLGFSYRADRRIFYSLLLPILLMLLASALHLYPLLERFWLFTAPILLIFISFGFEYFQRSCRSGWTLLLFCALLAGPVIQSVYFIVHPHRFYKHKKSYEREALTYIDQHLQQGDAVYNYWNNSPGYSVYKRMYRYKYQAFQGKDYRLQSGNLDAYNSHLKAEFTMFYGKKRIWVVVNRQFATTIGDEIDFPDWYYKNGTSPEQNLLQQLGKIGRQVKVITYPDIAVYLFLTNNKNDQMNVTTP